MRHLLARKSSSVVAWLLLAAVLPGALAAEPPLVATTPLSIEDWRAVRG